MQLEKRRSDEKNEKDRLNDIYLELIEKQRAYYKTVRDFQEVRVVHTFLYVHTRTVNCKENQLCNTHRSALSHAVVGEEGGVGILLPTRRGYINVNC